MNRHRTPLYVTLAVLFFFYLPLLVVAVNSFNKSRSAGAVWGGFTTRNYVELFHNRDIGRSIKNTLVVGLTATAISTVLGTLAALALYRYRGRLQMFHHGLVYTPLVIPDLLMGISLLLLFMSLFAPANAILEAAGWESRFGLGLGTITIAHATFCISYVAMTVLARLQDFDWTLIEAARDLGASAFTATRKVLLPLLAPGILAGALLAFTLSVDDYVVTFFVKGTGESMTLPIHIEGIISRNQQVGIINALSVVMLAATFFLTWASMRLTRAPGR